MVFSFEEGELLLIDKPIEWTSFDAVNFIRSFLKHCFKLKKLKVGHAGTLDPLATGLLLVCTGKKTKTIQDLQNMGKTYTGTMLLGQTTPSFDMESEPDGFFSTENITAEELETARMKFIGAIEQIPPIYSAIKIDGKRAFLYARKNQDVNLIARKITIYDFELTAINLPVIEFKVSCSKGTYIRSLVNDFGAALNNGACLTSLRRTHIGAYSVEDSFTIDQFRELVLHELNP